MGHTFGKPDVAAPETEHFQVLRSLRALAKHQAESHLPLLDNCLTCQYHPLPAYAEDSILASQTTWRGVMIDPQMPVNSMYGPGLVFSVLMPSSQYPPASLSTSQLHRLLPPRHLQVASPTMVCVGGRVDHLVGSPNFMYWQLRSPSRKFETKMT